MKKKELKALAQQIAEAELIIQQSDDKKEVSKAQRKIVELAKKVTNFEDIMDLDELVQEILSEKI